MNEGDRKDESEHEQKKEREQEIIKFVTKNIKEGQIKVE